MPIDWYSGKTKIEPEDMPPLQTSTKDDWGYKILDSEEIVEACCDLEEVDICESCQ